jgi:hypothetical protein
MDPSQRLSLTEERKEYEAHENSPDSSGYVAFLNRAIGPALSFLPNKAKGLDYGSGPGPALSMVLESHGFSCDNYDPLFGPPLEKGPYEFVFSTECFEHFYNPVEDLNRIDQVLKPGGFLIVMTLLRTSETAFGSWFYARDRSHVLFYTMSTFKFIAQRWGYQWLWDDGERVVILQKQSHLPE